MDDYTARQKIKDYWNDYAPSFDEAHAKEDKHKWFEYFRNLMGTAQGQKVLDIGTGTGFLALMAAELGFETVGIDFAEEMLTIAERKAKEKHLMIQFQNADLNELPFEDEAFDYIVNSRVLWTLTDPEKALTEWYRVLNKGGQVLSFVRLADEDISVHTPDKYYGAEVTAKLGFGNASSGYLIEVCHKCGYKNVDLVKLPGISYDHETYHDCWYVLRAMKEAYQQNRAIDAISGFWNRRSETYDAQHELTSQEYWHKYLTQFVGDKKDVKIIDLATGTGMIANMLGSLGYSDITGMDISEGMMDIARKHAAEQNTGVTFTYGNALELPLEESSVDVLINCRLLWTLLEPEKALTEWIRVVKPGGRIISLHEMEESISEEEQNETWHHFLYGKNADPYLGLNKATKAEYLSLFTNSGLKKVELIHMKECQTLENGKHNWYALIGTK